VKKITLLVFSIFCSFSALLSQKDAPVSSETAPLSTTPSAEDQWVEETYNGLNEAQRLGQLVMIRAHSNLGADHIAQVERLIRDYHVGGLCFFQGTPEKQAELTNQYQKQSKIPLMVAMDAEWGLSMRLKESTILYPKQLMLGAIQDNKLIYRFGEALARECKRLGVHVNFAPVADVNNNPNNPVINERSFGEDKFNVAAKSFMYMKGMQDNGVLACAKHFPGHGDTDVDSHYDLPVIRHDLTRLDDLELMPFRVLSQYGIASFMIAHMHVPAIDATANLPTSLSKNAIVEILRRQLGYNGVVFTDGLEMKGVTKHFPNGEISARAIAAGNDMLLLPESTEEALKSIRQYIAEGKIDTAEVAASVKRILRAKYKFGISTPQYVEVAGIRSDINSYESQSLKRELIQNALTLVRTADSLLPFRAYMPDSIAGLAIGASKWTPFQYQLNNSGIFNQFNVSKNFSAAKKAELLAYFSKKSTVVVSLHDMEAKSSADFGISANTREFIRELSTRTKVVLVVFGNPYAMKFFDDIPNVLVCYNEDKMTQELAGQGLFGVFEFKGKLPVTASEKAKCGMGLITKKRKDLLEWRTDDPQSAGFDPIRLAKIDAVAEELIQNGAAPSCQILVAKDGKVVYHKSFGHQTYDKQQPADISDLYDLASITKVASTTLSLMKLYDDGKISMDDNLGKHLPNLKGSNKENLKLGDVLVHQAGLQAWIPFYKQTLDSVVVDGKIAYIPSAKYYKNAPDGEFTVPVAQNFFMKTDRTDTVKSQIAESPLRKNTSYVYSDLGLILLTDFVKNCSGSPLDVFSTDNFYTPLGLNSTLFNPLNRFDATRMAPTEEDRYFRMQRLQGTVHDMAGAMLGGVSGHAGLFSNAGDLAVLFQMLLQKGSYGGVQYLKPETVSYFTTRQKGSTRRGYGWDMKELSAQKTANMSTMASAETFGHTGFTGNAAYADPQKNLVYIFLSNRTYPDMSNNKLISGDYRPRIQSLIYAALK
jgi:beta-N-acetylhexosaminidase